MLAIAAGAYFDPATVDGGHEPLRREIASGAAALRSQPYALKVFGADVLCSWVYGTLTVLLVLFAHRIGAGDSGYGYLIAGFGLGGVLAARLASAAGRSRRMTRGLVLALFAVAVPLPLLIFTPTIGAAVALCVVAGGGCILVEVLAETTLQRSLDDAVFARAYGIALPVSLGGIVLGALTAGPLLGALGLSGALVSVGVVVAVYAVVVVARAMPRPVVARSVDVAA